MINGNKRHNRINGLIIEGEWCTDPVTIKSEVLQFFKDKFNEEHPVRPKFINNNFKKLDANDRDSLDRGFTIAEVKEAVWSCGNDKAPGPDGFTFKFIKTYWDTLKDDFFGFVKKFEETGAIIDGCNSSFISLIPKKKDPLFLRDFRPINLLGCMYKTVSKVLTLRLKAVMHKLVGREQSAYIAGRSILDGPLIINELITWAKKVKRKALIFKVDFDKAFDSINWGFLDSVLEQMEFSRKWRGWINGCLSSGRGSVIVNGSATNEFDFKRGVRQGDPLAPFLFILAMEGLSLTMREACEQHRFQGISTPNGGPMLSHLMYADDVTFIGDWSEMNLINLNRILRCFYLASGLKVNLNKSKVFGVGVEDEEIADLAGILNCDSGTFPFTYLGLPLGANMRLVKHWNPIIEKFRSRLSGWKAKHLSFAGRLTLVKSVLGSLPLYYFSLFKAPRKVLDCLEGIRRSFLWQGSSSERKIHWVAWSKIVLPKDRGGLGVGCLNVLNLAMLAKWVWRYRNEDNNNSLWLSCIKAWHNIKAFDGKPIARASLKGKWWSIAKVQKELEEWNINFDGLMERKIGNGNNTHFWKDRWLEGEILKEIYPELYKVEAEKDCKVGERLGGNSSMDWNWKRDLRRGKESNTMEDLINKLVNVRLNSKNDSWRWKLNADGSFSVSSLRMRLVDHLALGGMTEDFIWNMEGKTRKMFLSLGYTVIWLIWKERNERLFGKRIRKPMQLADDIQLYSFNWIKNRGDLVVYSCGLRLVRGKGRALGFFFGVFDASLVQHGVCLGVCFFSGCSGGSGVAAALPARIHHGCSSFSYVSILLLVMLVGTFFCRRSADLRFTAPSVLEGDAVCWAAVCYVARGLV
ncbi:hypothetical protein LXL04_010712 [Taraxacum kok-saghyz]